MSDDPWITIDEAAAILGLERSGVYRRAMRGDFGPIRSIGGTKRPSITLVNATQVDAFKAGHLPRHPGALTAERLLADDLANDLDQVNPRAPSLARWREARQQ